MYVIPKGTLVEVNNIHFNDKPRQSTTEHRLEFETTVNTSCGGSIVSFLDGDWHVSVHKDKVIYMPRRRREIYAMKYMFEGEGFGVVLPIERYRYTTGCNVTWLLMVQLEKPKLEVRAGDRVRTEKVSRRGSVDIVDYCDSRICEVRVLKGFPNGIIAPDGEPVESGKAWLAAG